MEFDWIPRWWGVITTLVAVAAMLAMLWLSKTFARREDLKQMASEVDGLTSRVTGLENRVDNLPSQEQFSAMQVKMAELGGQIDALREALKPVHNVAQLLLEQRLNEK